MKDKSPLPLKTIGLLGGTFDPIHLGHLHIASTMLQTLQLDEVQFIPCGHPPHRQQPQASANDRLAMAQAALSRFPQFSVNPLEVHKNTPSYSIETLKALRQEYPNASFVFILGMDSFQSFHTWHDWRHFLDYTHLAIVNRPGYASPLHHPELESWLQEHQITTPTRLHQELGGCIILCPIPPCPISATSIRKQLSHQEDLETGLPQEVWEYIQAHHLYGI